MAKTILGIYEGSYFNKKCLDVLAPALARVSLQHELANIGNGRARRDLEAQVRSQLNDVIDMVNAVPETALSKGRPPAAGTSWSSVPNAGTEPGGRPAKPPAGWRR